MGCVQMTILRKFGFERGEERGEGADKMLVFVGGGEYFKVGEAQTHLNGDGKDPK